MNELKRIDEFRQVLANYQPSESAKQTLKHIQLVLLVGVSGGGRNTIIDALCKKHDDYRFIVSDTTRKPRVNQGILEVTGRQYWFRTEDEVLAELRAGDFLEAAIIHNQQVSGMSIRELESVSQARKIAINEVEVVGAAHIHDAKPDTVIIFVVPPNFDEWLKRLEGRGALPAAELRRRLESACTEYAVALEHDYYHFVVNDVLEDALVEVDALARTGQRNPAEEQRTRQLVEQLLLETQNHLQQYPLSD